MVIITDPKEMMECPLGIYIIMWTDETDERNGIHSGAHSIASVGMGGDGKRWIAPSNWVHLAPLKVDRIYKMIRLFGQHTYSRKQLMDMITNHVLLGE